MRIIISFFTLFIAFSIKAQPFFNTNSPTDETFLHHDIVDVDQDGDEDYLVWTFNVIKWYDEVFNFENEHVLYESPLLQFAINIPFIDINNDGLKDLLFREFNDSLYVVHNLGGGDFDTIQPVNLGFFTNNSELHDLNNDGVLDKLIQNDGHFYYQLNQGNWTFDSLVLIDNSFLNNSGAYYYYFPTVIDVNADGFLDLAFRANYKYQYQTTRNIILLNDSNGQFDYRSDLLFSNTEGQGPIWYCNLLTHQFDYDNDGDLDLYYSTNENIYCVTNHNNLSYSQPQSILSTNNTGQIAFVDLDFDGIPELQVYSYFSNHEANYYKVDSNNVLATLDNNLFYQRNHLIQNVFYRDLDQDGKMDLISLQNKPTYSPSLKSTFHRNISNVNLGLVTVNVCDSSYILPVNDTIYASYQYLDTITIDSLNLVDIVFGKARYNTVNRTICSGNSFEFGTQTLVDSGEYIETFTNIYGCDSIITLNLSLVPQPQKSQQFIETELCQYYVNGHTYYSDTTFNTIFITEFDCDSIVEFTLDFLEPSEDEDQYEEINLGTFVPNPNLIKTIDFDNDGDMDILASSNSDLNSLFVLEQTTMGHYKNEKYSIETPIEFFVKKDINNNGVLDIAFNEDFGIIFHNCGVQISNFDLNYMRGSKFSNRTENIDVNGDNIEDQVVFRPYWNSSFSRIQLKLKINQPNGILKEYDVLENSTKDVWDLNGTPLLTNFKYGYFNQDSILDFVLYTQDGPQANTTSYIYLFLSDSNYNYSQKVLHWSYSQTSYRSFIGSLEIVDFDMNGLMDIVYSLNGSVSKNRIDVYYQNEEGDSLSFTEKQVSHYAPVVYCEPMNNNQLFGSLFENRYYFDVDEYGGCALHGFNHEYGEGLEEETEFIKIQGIYDTDSDGDDDIVFGNTFYRNDDDSNYVLDQTNPIFTKYTDFSYLKDIDGDGDYDLMYNNGLQFAERIHEDSIGPLINLLSLDLNTPFANHWYTIGVHDLDQDGDQDVIGYYTADVDYPQLSNSRLLIFENDGSGELLSSSELDYFPYDYTKIIDLNQDGYMDVFLEEGWLKNTQSLGFEFMPFPDGVQGPQVALDYNQDGYIDLLSKKGSVIAWYFNDGFENFELGELITTKASLVNQFVSVIDFEHDGDLDVYLREDNYYPYYQHGSFHVLYRNTQFNISNPNPNPTSSEDEIEFVVYPNPNSGMFGVMSPYDNLNMTVYSLEGKLLATQVLQKDLNQVNLVGHLPSGMYLLTFTKPGEFSKTERLIISK